MHSSLSASLPRVALIGVTGYGKSHLQVLLPGHHDGKWELAAATIINPEDAADEIAMLDTLGTRIYSNYQEMLERESPLDLVCIPTAIHWHSRMTLDALEAGAHVFVEKPLAGSVAEVDEILAARNRSGKFVAVGFQDLYGTEAWQVKDVLLSGRLGKLQRLKGCASWPRLMNYYERNGWAGKYEVQGRPVLDSPLNNALSHYVNLLLFFAGSERDTSAEVTLENAALFRVQPIETFDTASVQGRTADGAEFFFHATHSAKETLNPVIRAECEHGAVEWSPDHGVTVDESGHGHELLAGPGFNVDFRSRVAASLQQLIRGGAALHCSVEIARQHVRFIAGLHEKFSPVEVPQDRKSWTSNHQWIVPDLLAKLKAAYASNTLIQLD